MSPAEADKRIRPTYPRPIGEAPSLDARACGLLLHVTSLPGGPGCGDIGDSARRFVDNLHTAGIRWWQMLPLHPVDRTGCPYKTPSVFASNPLLIDLDALVDEGLLNRSVVRKAGAVTAHVPPETTDYRLAAAARIPPLRAAFRAFRAGGGCQRPDYTRFITTQVWLDDFALFMALKRVNRGRPWLVWPRRHRLLTRPQRLRLAQDLAEEIEFTRFCQFIFDAQWSALRAYATSRNVGLLGDVPFFVAQDSADVWAAPERWDLDDRGRPRTVSGVPPDLFNRHGQLWRHPQYRWRRHLREGFAWWVGRFERAFELFHAVRLDHFIGLHRLWAIPAGNRDARQGRWFLSPGWELLATLSGRFGRLPMMAEDLGLLTPQAAALRDAFELPGCRVLQFGFDSDDAGARYHRPEACPPRSVAFTGTHDNDTLAGWLEGLRTGHRASRAFQKEHGQWDNGARPGLSAYERVAHYTGQTSVRKMHGELIRRLLMSRANLVVLPMQDVLRLGSEARMNRPGLARGNWRWRMTSRQLSTKTARQLREQVESSRRASKPKPRRESD